MLYSILAPSFYHELTEQQERSTSRSHTVLSLRGVSDLLLSQQVQWVINREIPCIHITSRVKELR